MARFVGAARRAAGRSFSSGKTEKLWTSLISNSGLISTSPIGFDIVEPVDWERSSVAQEHATLLRIRGQLSLIVKVTDSQYNAMIYVVNQSRGTSDPSSAQVLVDEDILWTYCVQGGNAPSTVIESMVIDVRAKRKITSSTDVRMVEISDTVNGFLSTYVLRGLVQVK